jgi:hypothetical protein
MINNYETFNERKSFNFKKLTYSLVGKAWNALWKKHKFKYPNIIITCIVDDENDIGLFEVFKYQYNDGYPGYNSLGTKYLRPIEEERKEFIKWLIELNLIEK